MSNPKYTPGPWKSLAIDGGEQYIFSQALGYEQTAIACVLEQETSEETEANARLLECSIELLEKLEEVSNYISKRHAQLHPNFDPELNGLAWQAFDLINRIKGDAA
jgi:phosphoglycerate-specific signal transduction histidine kinase